MAGKNAFTGKKPKSVFPAKAGIFNAMKYYVYILTNFAKTVLYIGFTGDLPERLNQHKTGKIKGFTKRYKADILIYYEEFQDVHEAKAREKAMKKWNRAWKEDLINKSNPGWAEILIM